mgnify:CR=1 FL=1
MLARAAQLEQEALQFGGTSAEAGRLRDIASQITDYGFKPLDVSNVTGRISTVLSDPKLGSSENVSRVLSDVGSRIGEWVKRGGGTIDADALYMIRKEGVPKVPHEFIDPKNPWTHFREATWEEALDRAAAGLRSIREREGGKALAGFGSAKCSNEEAYLFQKLVRQGFGTNNVDHCTRLCHASSVAALMEGLNSGAVTAPFMAAKDADCIIVIGARPSENHPVAATYLRNAVRRGAKLIVMDPRGRLQGTQRYATHALQFKSGTDVALLNAMLNVIIEDKLYDAQYVAAMTEGFDGFRASIKAFTPEYASALSGVPADRIREAALIYGEAERGMLLWGMGITQHLTGVDGALAMANLSILTGHVGRPGTGFIPLRGQSNVQGASDMQGQHNALPGYHSIKDPKDRAKFERAWGVPMPDNQFLTVVQLEEGAVHGEIRGMYVMGENPMGSSPDIAEVEHGLRTLDFLVVQDMFLSETAELADVVLPVASFAEKDGTFTNTERRVQLLRPAVAPPGAARPDWQIVCDIATAMGYPMSYPSTASIMDEIASLVPSYAGMQHHRLGNGGLQWPCLDSSHPGTRFLYAESFPTPSGKAAFSRVTQSDLGADIVDDKFPLNLNTGRLLEHYHTGTMTRRSRGLDHMKPEGEVEVHPEDARRYGLDDGCRARIVTKRGAVEVKVKVTEKTLEGAIFYPFHFGEAPANRLTNAKFDQASHTPAYKRTAARLERIV